jgi:hypothetical protein
MAGGHGGLKRIAKLYGVVERMHALRLEQASAGVREVVGAIGVERAAGAAAGVAGRLALGSGDHGEWMLAQAQREMAGMRRVRLEGLRDERGVVEMEAKKEFLESRVRTEQVKQVVEKAAAVAAVDEGRRTQAAADDRYAARLLWLGGRDRREAGRKGMGES